MNQTENARKFLSESSWVRGALPKQSPKPPAILSYDPEQKIIPLPEPELLKDHYINFLEMVELRSTIREYSKESLSLKELSYLLWCTQGIKAFNGNTTLRTVPSAGASHSFETYLLVNNVEETVPGVYRFLPVEHALLPVQADMLEITDCFSTNRVVQNSAVSFIWSTIIQRLAYRFGSRAYRYAFLDAGHICQNLYLAAQTVDIGICPLGAFDDKRINAALHFDENEQFVIYGAATGKI